MRVLVTGGAGFIGSHLIERLRELGHGVASFDRRGIRGYQGDCRTVSILRYAAAGSDFCFHLASTVGVQNVLRDPAECIDNIVNSTKAVLSLGVPGIYFSTSEVFGKNASGSLGEDSDCVLSSKARWSYAAAKLAGEWMALQAGWKVVRPFNVVGPRQNLAYGAVVPRFVRQALDGDPITVYGDGSQTRTFIDVRDFVDVLLGTWGKPYDVVNIGGREIFEVRQLAEFVKHHFNSKSPIQFIPYQDAYPKGFEECPSRIPSWKKLESLVGIPKLRKFGETLDSIAESMERTHEPVSR